MTVYVDNARIAATVANTKGRWSHMTADAKTELVAFAESIGLRAEWFQTCKSPLCKPETCVHWHFDVTDSKRREAIAAGAQAVDIRAFGAICSARRKRPESHGDDSGVREYTSDPFVA